MLVRQISEIRVALAPFNTASKSSRLFINHINTDEARQINPALKITTQILSDPTAPSQINVVYRDGKKVSFQADKYKIDYLLQTVNKHAKKLEEADQANAW